MTRARGIEHTRLMLNVKASVMDRVARCCHADIVPSIAAAITKPRLGTCRLFHVETPAAGAGQHPSLPNLISPNLT